MGKGALKVQVAVNCSRGTTHESPTTSPTCCRTMNAQRKRRASKACTCCRARKLRCVLDHGPPCTRCQVDGFECTVQERKKRRRRNDIDTNSPRAVDSARDGDATVSSSIPEHIMLHQVPHYPFFRSFNPEGKPWLQAQDTQQGVVLPVSPRDQSNASRADLEKVLEDFQFLRHKGALDLPPENILMQCVSTYFQLFHSFFPVVDRAAFLQRFHGCDQETIRNGKGPSMLLLQAIVFTASAVRFYVRSHMRD